MTGDRRTRSVIRIETVLAKRRARRKPNHDNDLPPAPAMALRAA